MFPIKSIAMKSICRLFTIIALFVFILSNTLIAQPLPGGTNPGGGGPASPPTGNPLNGPLGGPVGDSVLPLVLLACAYGLVKLYGIYKIQKAGSEV
jgi:hypothetical protein